MKTSPSPQIYARTAAVLYLIVIAAGMIAELGISGRMVVAGDAAATAANILSRKDLFQLGFTVYLIEMTCQIAQATLFYFLLRPVNRNVALLALVFSLIGCTVKTLSRLFYIAPLLVLGGSHYLNTFNVEQLQGFALLLLDMNSQAAGIALPFFGISTFLNGILIFRSAFLPRFLGVLSILGGLGWFIYIYPPLGNQLFVFIMLIALIGSAAEILWLLFKGVNVERWQKLNIEYT
jgi:hypothetical protein